MRKTMKSSWKCSVVLLSVLLANCVSASDGGMQGEVGNKSDAWFGISRPAQANLAIQALLATVDLSRQKLRASVELDSTMDLSQLASAIRPGEVSVSNAILVFRTPNPGKPLELQRTELANRLSVSFPKASAAMHGSAAEAILELSSFSEGNYFQKCISIFARFSSVAEDSDLCDLCLITAVATTVYAEHLPQSHHAHANILFELCSASDRVRAHGLLGQLLNEADENVCLLLVDGYFSTEFNPVGELPAGQPEVTAFFEKSRVREILDEPYPAQMTLDEFNMYDFYRSDECPSIRGMCLGLFAKLADKKLIPDYSPRLRGTLIGSVEARDA